MPCGAAPTAVPSSLVLLRIPDGPQEISYVSRRRMDDATFDPDAVDADGQPLVYNEVRQFVCTFDAHLPG